MHIQTHCVTIAITLLQFCDHAGFANSLALLVCWPICAFPSYSQRANALFIKMTWGQGDDNLHCPWTQNYRACVFAQVTLHELCYARPIGLTKNLQCVL